MELIVISNDELPQATFSLENVYNSTVYFTNIFIIQRSGIMLNKSTVFRSIIYFILMVMTPSVMAQVVANTANQAPISELYQIGPGDLLKISVWKEENMQLDVLVRPDGNITFP